MPFRYQRLKDYLAKSNKAAISLTKGQIEKICGFELPKSSSIDSWWSNTPEDGHSQARAWTEAGYRVTIDAHKIVFRR